MAPEVTRTNYRCYWTGWLLKEDQFQPLQRAIVRRGACHRGLKVPCFGTYQLPPPLPSGTSPHVALENAGCFTGTKEEHTVVLIEQLAWDKAYVGHRVTINKQTFILVPFCPSFNFSLAKYIMKLNICRKCLICKPQGTSVTVKSVTW